MAKILGQMKEGAPIQGAQALLKAIQQAADAKKSFVLINDAPDFEQYHDEALAEELSHALQAGITGKTKTHLDAELGTFTEAPIYQKAAKELRKRYTDVEPGGSMEATEVGVRLMRPGGYKELGLTIPEARSLAAHYVRTLRREHGSKSPRQIADAVFGSFRGSNPSPAKPREVSDGPDQRRGAGTAVGAGRDLPAGQTAAAAGNDQQPRVPSP